MAIRERMSGNEAVAYAMKQINPDVMGAFPITPSTEIPQYFSKYIADGKVETEFVAVESEHSAMSVCIGAAAAGARAVTATSSAGLAFMWELLYVAASSRIPITMAVVNRALTGPININNDHSDSMGIRDAGWIQIYAENNQEAYDNFLQAMPIGEHPDVRLPVMDGLEAARAIRRLRRKDAGTLPIVAMSANAFAEDVNKSKAAGMNEHLAKPIDLKKLLAVMQRYWQEQAEP